MRFSQGFHQRKEGMVRTLWMASGGGLMASGNEPSAVGGLCVAEHRGYKCEKGLGHEGEHVALKGEVTWE